MGEVREMSEFKFALSLLRTTTGNACVSPLNIAHALGMVMLGSEPETRDEVSKAVGFVAAQDAHDKLSQAIQNLKNNDIASVAARLFVQRGFQLKDQFQSDAEKKYGSVAEKVDFCDAEKCANTINGWVAESTKNMITELFSAGDIDPNMLVALCSALHFKGSWAEPFDSPFKDEFHFGDDTSVETDFILKKSKFPFNYCGELSAQVVELAYTNGTQMILVRGFRQTFITKVIFLSKTFNLEKGQKS